MSVSVCVRDWYTSSLLTLLCLLSHSFTHSLTHYATRSLIADMYKSLALAGSVATATAALPHSHTHLSVNESRSFEVMLPTRDGVSLHTRVVMPKDDASEGGKYTTIVDRSPYGYLGLEWIPGERHSHTHSLSHSLTHSLTHT